MKTTVICLLTNALSTCAKSQTSGSNNTTLQLQPEPLEGAVMNKTKLTNAGMSEDQAMSVNDG